MSNSPAPPPKALRVSPGLIGAGVLVMLLGFGLPLLAPKAAPTDEAPREAAPLTPAPVQPPSAPNLVGSLLKLVVGLAVVCGLCVLAAKYVGPKPPPAPGSMTVDASIVVGPCVLHLVRAGDRRLLVGTDPAGVKAVLELPGTPPTLPQEEADEATVPEAAPEVAPAPVVETAPRPAPAPEAEPAPETEPEPEPEPAESVPAAASATQQKLLNLLLQLRAQKAASPPP
jgi:flagellar biogenesis protein FliO